ncbi:uncharacterized protein BJ171DRAFT_572993 [Polychytrium aggregatum]|uniref:uncharacterized protein n=1 Tax=Polychytrium aggregatum TaxID=110093 RepID=UPI0022FE55C4|nr:uncharacterized protein BJ171DRAFT_572993 [Polychytrium aggregatum]KAI9193143.1 hypothetical protein BJ171DRAFT_572993 [Polychytrium aggregatum]
MWQDCTIDGDYSSTVWHRTTPLLAAAKDDGSIEIFSDEGTRLDKASIQKEAKVCAMTWHPSRRLLAAGWSTGTVGVWCDAEQALREGNIHQCPVGILEWSFGGNRLISADQDGVVVVWKVDQRGRITSLCQYRLKGGVSFCLFRSTRSSERDQRRSDSPPFFLTTTSGSLYYADDMGHCAESASVSPPVISMGIFQIKDRDILFALSSELVLLRYNLTQDGKLSQELEMKLSAGARYDRKNLQAVWIGVGTLALSFCGQFVKIWDLLNEETQNLTIPDADGVRFNCLSYSSSQNMLAAGTDSGHVIVWRLNKVVKDDKHLGFDWKIAFRINTGGCIDELHWGGSSNLLSVRKKNSVKILTRTTTHWATNGKLAVIQSSPKQLLCFNPSKEKFEPYEVEFSGKIKGAHLSSNHLAIWDGTQIEIFEFGEDGTNFQVIGTITSDSLLIAVDRTALYLAKKAIDVCNLQGVMKTSVSVSEKEGEIIALRVSHGFLLLATSNNFIKLFDVSSKDPKYICTKQIDEQVSESINIQELLSIKHNSSGTFVSILATTMSDEASNNPRIDTGLLIYDVDHDEILQYDFSQQNLRVTSHFWDQTDPRILVCEAQAYATLSGSSTDSQSLQSNEICSFFVVSTHGIVFQDRYSASDADTLIEVNLPFHIFMQKYESNETTTTSVFRKPTHDYVGIEESDASTLRAMTDFSFHLTTGNIDDALKAVRFIKYERVWENMARKCVKMKRMDVAVMCLGSMGYAEAVSALNEAKNESDDVKAAIAATYLGMTNDVEELYLSAQRYDLLNEYYQCSGNWEWALDTAASRDRISLRSTFCKFGRYLQEIGDISGAIAAFEKSSACNYEIPRLLAGRDRELKDYIDSSESKPLKKWWAQYLESTGDYEAALKFYEQSGDNIAIVRLYCCIGKLDQAMKLADQSNSPAAAYFIANHLENEGNISDAISFYSKAKCFTQAISIAQLHGMDDQLMYLALQGSKESMLNVARYYEAKRKYLDKAISLYYKSGHISKALQLCFDSKQHMMLQDLVESLGEGVDPKLLSKCAQFFIENQQHTQAVRLLLKARNVDEAIQVAQENGVTITEELADLIQADKSGSETAEEKEMCLKLAQCCLQQRSYHLACKKFTQGGDRLQAMKSLLKSGDTEKIIFFANVSGPKQKEIYVLAANYLQTLDWRNYPSIMKAIILFYSKAKAFDSLSGFYQACAQVEIDEYQNYEKALGAFREAAKCSLKGKDRGADDPQLASMDRRIYLVSKFVEARKLAKTDVEKTFSICEALLREPDIEYAVRMGDIYALLVECHFDSGNHEQALEVLHKMKSRKSTSNIEFFVDRNILQALDKSYGATQGDDGSDIVEELPDS